MSDKTVSELQLLITANAQKADQELQRIHDKLEKLEKKGPSAGKGISDGLKAGAPDISKFGLALGAAGIAAGAFSVGMEALLKKEDQLADFSALTGVTGKKLVEFGDMATEMSNEFGTSTSDNIEVFKSILGRLGPAIASSSDAVRTMSNDVNILSKASGLSAQESMDALTTTMLQFGVSLDDPIAASSEMTRIMNILAAGAQLGAAEIPQLSEAMKQVGSTAKSLNISVEETTAGIETLAMAGKFGSEAGVGFRNVLTSLTKQSKEGEEALKGIGTSTSELANILTTKGATAAFTELNSKLDSVPNLAERAAIKVTLFGKENLSSASGLLANVKAMQEFKDGVGGTSTAVEQAAIKMATTTEKMKRMREEGINTLVHGFEMIGDWVGKSIVGTMGKINQFIDTMGKLVTLDLSGFWKRATMSTNDYIQSQDKLEQQQEQQYQKLLKQTDEQIKQSDLRKNKALLEEAIGKELNKSNDAEIDRLSKLSVATTAYMQKSGKAFGELSRSTKVGLLISDAGKLFVEGQIKTIDDYFLRSSDKEKANAAESDKERKKRLSDLAAYNKARIEAIVDPIQRAEESYREAVRLIDVGEQSEQTKQAERILALKKYGDESGKIFDDISKGVSAMPAFTATAMSIQDSIINRIMKSTSLVKDEIKGDVDWIADIVGKVDQYANKIELYKGVISTSFGSIGTAIGSAISGEQAMSFKDILKDILSQLITFAETEWVIANAIATIRAFATFGVSALADTWGWIASFAALEAAKALVGSFAVGAWSIPQTQLAMVHSGEMVIPKAYADSVRSGDAVISSGSRKRNKPQTLRGKIDLNITSFSSANKYSTFALDSGVM